LLDTNFQVHTIAPLGSEKERGFSGRQDQALQPLVPINEFPEISPLTKRHQF
jgi:hypothetical protein